MNTECNKLDAFLADDLPADEAARFENHLSHCETCRDVINQQRWIDALLQSPVRSQLEQVRVDLLDLARTRANPRRRIARLAACGLAAAATLLIALGWWQLNRQAIDSASRTTTRNDAAESAHVPISAPPKATFVGGPDVIAVPIESHHPDVTIVRIYPTYQPPDNNQLAAVPSSAAPDPTLYDYSNGG